MKKQFIFPVRYDGDRFPMLGFLHDPDGYILYTKVEKKNELKVSVPWKLLLQFLFERSHFFLIHRHLLLLLSLTQRGKRIYNRLRGRVRYVDGNSDDIDLGHNLPVGRWENFK